MHSLIMITWMFVLGLMLTSQCHAESVLTFKATPKIIKSNLTRSVTMRCAVAVNQARHAQSDKEVASVTQYWVTYGEDEYVAEVKDEAAKGFIDEGNLRVSGNVSGMGYLELTWHKPSTMRIGTYKCHVNAKSKGNKFVPLRATLTLSTEEPTITDLLERINDVEQQSNDADKNQLERINDVEQHSNDAEKKLEEANKKLEEANKKQVSVTRCLSQKVAFMATFMVTLSSTGYLQMGPNVTIVYHKVITNVGDAYDSSNGRFTATTPGIYAFYINAMAKKQMTHVNLNIKVNDEIVTSQVARNGANEYYNSGSARAVVGLVAGDVVSVETEDVFSNTHSMYKSSAYTINVNTFSGELLSPDCTE